MRLLEVPPQQRVDQREAFVQRVVLRDVLGLVPPQEAQRALAAQLDVAHGEAFDRGILALVTVQQQALEAAFRQGRAQQAQEALALVGGGGVGGRREQGTSG
ncbi:hypothetical protein ACQ86G_13305 [Roseateles chitinivorans]|uniref:hypothetical protein n=1 Tax=Roseateles chitinivorans TaxID=2917965 RepID=UPI003D6715C3